MKNHVLLLLASLAIVLPGQDWGFLQGHGAAADLSGLQAVVPGDSGYGGENASAPAEEVEPVIAALDIEGADMVKPAFLPSQRRYAIYPGEMTSTITLTVQAASGGDVIRLDGVELRSGAPAALPLPVAGTSLTLTVTATGGEVGVYELMVLPAVFPELVVDMPGEGVAAGLVYLALRGGRNGPYYNVILDNAGVPVFIGETERANYDFKRQENGWMSYMERTGVANAYDRESAEAVILDEDYEEIGRYQTLSNLSNTDAHDFLILPNGHFVFLAYQGETREGIVYEDSVIQVVDPSSNEEVFLWNSKDDIPFEDSVLGNQEYAHINSVFLDHDGNFLASLRGTSQVVKIDRGSGDLLWKLGGLSSDFVIDDPWGGPCGQHTASRLDNGHILVFDNGTPCPDLPAYGDRPLRSRAAEYRLDLAQHTATLVWSYAKEGSFSQAGGSAQRLPNGNTLLGWGSQHTTLATEVDSEGRIVYELRAEPTAAQVWRSYRVFRLDGYTETFLPLQAYGRE